MTKDGRGKKGSPLTVAADSRVHVCTIQICLYGGDRGEAGGGVQICIVPISSRM